MHVIVGIDSALSLKMFGTAGTGNGMVRIVYISVTELDTV